MSFYNFKVRLRCSRYVMLTFDPTFHVGLLKLDHSVVVSNPATNLKHVTLKISSLIAFSSWVEKKHTSRLHPIMNLFLRLTRMRLAGSPNG